MLTTTNHAVLRPDQIEELVIVPVTKQSVAAQVSTIVTTQSTVTNFPILKADARAHWTAEGAEIQVSDPLFEEIAVTPSKIAGLVIISNETMKDATEVALTEIGNGLVRQFTESIDAAFFGSLKAPAPQGLGTITPTTLEIAGLNNLDWAEHARAAAIKHGSNVTSFVVNPDDMTTIATAKESANSQRGLLQPDPTQPTLRTAGGLPILESTHVDPGTIWAIPEKATKLVIRQDTEVIADGSAMFISDRVAIRGTMRAGFAFTAPASIVKITVTG